MANSFPALHGSLRPNGGTFRELDVLSRLRDSLPDVYDIYHNLALHTVSSDTDRYGEIDLLIVGPAGNILLMEVKAGAVILRNGDIFKVYGATEHDISRQCRFQYGAIVARLKDAGLHTSVASCLVIPDYTVGAAQVVSVPLNRIIDATMYDQLGTHVRAILAASKGCERPEALRKFLSNEFYAMPVMSVLRDQLKRSVRMLSDGLATWVPRISSASRVVRVQATAGSGKTQLAMQLINDAIGKCGTVGYVCYNRALADYIRSIAPANAEVSNFHDLAVESYRRVHGDPDFSDASVFAVISQFYIEACRAATARYDVLIIDEGQDFEPEWVEALTGLLNEEGYLYFMEDGDQRLYDRPGFDIDDAVTVTCRDNYRSPRSICDVINALALSSGSIRSMNDFKGEVPGFHIFDEAERSAQSATLAAVTTLLERGFAMKDIVVLTYKGRARSALLGQAQLGPYRTRQFTGSYTRDGEPVWTDGELLVESVYRYKGQSAPAVVLTEVDFSELAGKDKKRLFVGMTRAQMALEIVLTDAAEKSMMTALAA